mmetsp:Transcript_54009/g.158927  ORF Transcript_54009/g.158927 Transcript_54009/m.158927 type:complete len:525 (-) Transcript_54009:559-2133(-)
MLSTTSASSEASFRSLVSFLKAASFLAVASERVWISVSCSVMLFESSTVNLLTSRSFALMKPWAWWSSELASFSAASHSPMAFADSSGGSTSMPFRNGISASWHLAISASAFSTFSLHVTSMALAPIPCRCPFSTLVTSSSFFFEAVAVSFMAWSSSFTAPVAVLSFVSRVRIAFMICVCAGATIFSADCTSSSDICPRPSAELLIMAAFSTSISASVSFSVMSARAFRASTRTWNSFLKDLNGFSFRWASVSFVCIFENSRRAVLRVSGAYFLVAFSLSVTSLRASVILVCASSAAASTSAKTFARTSSPTGGSAMYGEAISETASVPSSAAWTRSRTAGKTASKSFASASSCFFIFSLFSAAAFSLTTLFFACMTLPFVLTSSALTSCCSVLSRGESFESSVTLAVAGTPPLRASAMSAVRDFCSSSSAATLACKASADACKRGSVACCAGRTALATTALHSFSAASTCAVAFLTRSAMAPAGTSGCPGCAVGGRMPAVGGRMPPAGVVAPAGPAGFAAAAL